VAREVLRSFVARQKTKPDYYLLVDGVKASSEDQVKPFGVIRYVFLRMKQVGKYAIQTARELSPVASGRYKRSWMLIADGEQVGEDQVPENTKQLILVNNQPYARKIHLRGARFRSVPPGIVEKVRQMAMRRFKTVDIQLRFIQLHGGYVLRQDYVQVRKSGRKRTHTKAGTELTYPALVMTQKFG
jgi:hypothetical protein